MDTWLDHYLDRLKLTKTPAGAQGLQALQLGQLMAIPFENIDPLLGIVPDLAPQAIRDKLLVQKRGGYCFELNGLLGQALTSLGYKATPLLAQVRWNQPSGDRPRTHLAWRVALPDGEWLVDAGFGGPGPNVPVPMNGKIIPALGTKFRVATHWGTTALERHTARGWFPVYAFDRTPATSGAIEEANIYCASDAQSRFPRHLMLNLFAPQSRKSVLDTQMSFENAFGIIRRPIADQRALAQTLAVFGLSLPTHQLDQIWQRIQAATRPPVSACNDNTARAKA